MLVEVMKLEYQLTPFNSEVEEEVIPDDSASVVAFNGGQEEQVDRISELEEEEGIEDIGSLIQSQFQPSNTRRSRVGTARSATSVPRVARKGQHRHSMACRRGAKVASRVRRYVVCVWC